MYTNKLKEATKKRITKPERRREVQGGKGTGRRSGGGSGNRKHAELAGVKVLMFASNNYLGLANHPEIVKAGKEALINTVSGFVLGAFYCRDGEYS